MVVPEPRVDDHLIRGNFGSYLGVCGDELSASTMYNIYSKEYPGESLAKIKKHIEKLAYNSSEFFAISDRYYKYNAVQSNKETIQKKIIVARGDCFYCASGVKVQYNFLDNQAPLNRTIVDDSIPATYSDDEKKFGGELFSKIGADGWLETNVSD